MLGLSEINAFWMSFLISIFDKIWPDRSPPVPDGPRSRGRPFKKGKMKFGRYPKTHPSFTRKGSLTHEAIGFIKCAFYIFGSFLTKAEYRHWFNLSSEAYEHYRSEPLGGATRAYKKKVSNPPERQLEDYEEKQRFLMKCLEENPFADYQDLHEMAKKAKFEGSYWTTWRCMRNLGVKIRVRPNKHWCGPEGIEVFKQRRLSYAEAHLNDNPEGLYFIDESIVRCFHRKKKQLCKKGQTPEPYEHMRYTAQCHVLGVIGHGGFRVLVNVTEILEQKKKERSNRKRRRQEMEEEDEEDNFKFGFTATDYQKVLDSHIIKPIREHNRALNAGRRPEDRVEPVLVQDRAPSHWAKDTLEYLQDSGMRIHYDWPRYSPDLNPIENLWGWLVNDLGEELYEHRKNTAENCEKVWKIVENYFYNRIPPDQITNLVESFSRRMEQVIAAGGHKLHY